MKALAYPRLLIGLLVVGLFLTVAVPCPADDAPPARDPSKSKVPAAYANRFGAARDKALKDYGGTRGSEAAVSKGLLWLALHQAPEGHWSLDGFSTHARKSVDDRDYFDDKTSGKSVKNDTAGAAFGLLPFLAAGVTHKSAPRKEDEPYVRTVKNGVDYLLQKQGKDGAFPGGMYANALATIAICEAFALSGDEKLKKPAEAAITYIVAAQDPKSGGWRYAPREGGDSSVTGWQIQALVAAKHAGLAVPKATLDGAEKWLDSCESKDGGGYGYRDGSERVATTAVGLRSRQQLGTPRRNLNQMFGVQKLKFWAPPESEENIYREYYATQVCFHATSGAWEFWNNGEKGEKGKKGMRDVLLQRQDRDGSWDPGRDFLREAGGGRIMQTSLSILSLQVYYREARYEVVIPRPQND